MITITKKPYICAFSKNNVDFHVNTNMLFTSTAVYPSLTIEVISAPVNGETFTFSWINPETGQHESITLVATETPNNLEFGIPSNTYGFSYTYKVFLGEVLKRSKLFNAWFTVDYSNIGSIVTITAKEAIQELVIDFTSSTSSFFAIFQDKDFISPVRRLGYEMRALVYFEKDYMSGEFEVVSNSECIVDDDQFSAIDVSEILDSEIENSWDHYPVPWKEGNSYIAKNLKRYYLKFVESWNNEQETISTTSDVFFVHWGGVSFDDQQMGDPVNLNAMDMNFLTWTPSGKKIDLNQDDWLGWMNLSYNGTYYVKVFIETANNSYVHTMNFTSLKKFESLVFNVGWNANNLNSIINAGEVIKHWSYQIFRGPNEMSPKFRFFEDKSCIKKVMSFFNSYGMPETFLSTGAWTETMNVSSTLANRSKSFNLNSLLPQMFVFDSKHNNSFKANTNVLSCLEAVRLQSILNSTIVHVLEHNRWIPALISTSKFPLMTINEYLAQIEFEILKANENDRASFFPLMPEIEIIEGNGIEAISLITNGLEIDAFGNLSIFNEAYLTYTFSWNVTAQRYESTAPIVAPGIYRAEGIVYVSGIPYKINKHFRYDFKKISLITYIEGSVSLWFASSNSTAEMIIEWGDGTTETINCTNLLSEFTHNYTKIGRKELVLKKPNFNDIIAWYCPDNIGNVDLSLMPNIETIDFRTAFTGNVYLSPLKKLKVLRIYNSSCNSVNLGFQKDLSIIYFKNLAFTEENLNNFFHELWLYRKLYADVPKTITIENVGDVPSSTVSDIINGANFYAGEGLQANYGWTIILI